MLVLISPVKIRRTPLSRWVRFLSYLTFDGPDRIEEAQPMIGVTPLREFYIDASKVLEIIPHEGKFSKVQISGKGWFVIEEIAEAFAERVNRGRVA